ncbi:Organic solute transporter Ostalpha domain containing protein [Naviculisporaceae sp. PSN 640]
MVNFTCNSTLEELRILPGTEIPIAGPLTFHQLALIIGGGTALIAILLSFYLIMMHATNYTVPHEQKQIIRILFMVPIYATSSFLMIRFYWHAIYFQVICDCYEAFAISSFFSLMCHYIAPDLHAQKEYFRTMHPIAPWVWPLNWFAKCCGGQRKGPWRTPGSGLTWFNIIWIGIYHYCFVRVAMTIAAVVTQYFHRYCESSNSPVFSHIWIVIVQSVAVTIAMYCLIQFYVQLRNTEQLKPNRPFLKVLAIKLVIFLSFWQSIAISLGTSTLDLVHPNKVLAYPDIKVGIPSLLLCIEMSFFALLHLWAFPYRCYMPIRKGGMPKQGGFLGVKALWDAVNIWDVVTGFGRGMRWLFVGIKHRHKDVSYASATLDLTTTRRKDSAAGEGMSMDMDDLGYKSPRNDGGKTNTSPNPLGMSQAAANNSTSHLPIATQFRASRYGYGNLQQSGGGLNVASTPGRRESGDERAGLINNAQPNPAEMSPPRERDRRDHSGMTSPYYEGPYDGPSGSGSNISSPPSDYVVLDMPSHDNVNDYAAMGMGIGMSGLHRPGSLSTVDEESLGWSRQGSRQDMYRHSPHPSLSQASRSQTPGAQMTQMTMQYQGQQAAENYSGNPNSTQVRIGEALWGSRPTTEQQRQ